MKIVKFEDGTYALRKFSVLSLGYVYRDPSGYWWTIWSKWFDDCRVDYETAVRMMDIGAPV
jgi:hypothetical protein